MIECPQMQDQLTTTTKIFTALYCLQYAMQITVSVSLTLHGAYGRSNDASVLASSLCGSALDTIPSTLNLPVPAKCGSKMLPYVLLKDEALSRQTSG